MEVKNTIFGVIGWAAYNMPMWVGAILMLMGALKLEMTGNTDVEQLTAVITFVFGAGLVCLNIVNQNIQDLREDLLNNNTNLPKK